MWRNASGWTGSATRRRRSPRQTHAAPKGRAARGAVARRKLHGAGRFRLPDRAALDRLARGGGHHHLGRVALRHRRQAQHAATALQAAAARLRRSRMGRRDAGRGGYGFPAHHGRRSDGGRARRLHDRARRRTRRARRGHPCKLRSRRRRQQQSAQSHHQYPLVRREPAGRGAAGACLCPRSAKQRDAGHAQAFPRPWRHRCRFAHRTANDSIDVRAARLDRPGAVPRRHRCRRPGRDERAHRISSVQR